MMYPFMTLSDNTEIAHSNMGKDGRVKVYIERPDEKLGFMHATCYLPDYKWEDVVGYTHEEIAYLQTVIKPMEHSIMRYAKEEAANPKGFESNFNNDAELLSAVAQLVEKTGEYFDHLEINWWEVDDDDVVALVIFAITTPYTEGEAIEPGAYRHGTSMECGRVYITNNQPANSAYKILKQQAVICQELLQEHYPRVEKDMTIMRRVDKEFGETAVERFPL